MSYTRYVYDLPLCKSCGMPPENTGGYMCDQYTCPSCGASTMGYWDGVDLAFADWCKMQGVEVQDMKRAIVEG